MIGYIFFREGFFNYKVHKVKAQSSQRFIALIFTCQKNILLLNPILARYWKCTG